MGRSICICGAPGAGKTSVGKALAAVLDLQHLSAGDVMRKLAQSNQLIRQALEQGQMAPARLVDELLHELLQKDTLVMDGYPRYMSQLESAIRIEPRPMLVMLHLTPEESLARLEHRARMDYHQPREMARLEIYGRMTYPMALEVARYGGINIYANQPLRATLGQIEDHYRSTT